MKRLDLNNNYNIIVNDYTGRRMVEVDQQGNVVHEMRTGSRTMASIAVVE